MKKLLQTCLAAFALPLALLAGCGTRTPLDVGQVVVAPQVVLPPVPTVVQQTEPKPVGYFQCLYLTYLGESCESPTKSTSPTEAVDLTPSQ